LYGLWVVFLVIAGRAHVTTRNFPAALAGLVANVVLLVTLVPVFGIAGAGVALCGAYVVMLTVMHLLTRRAFPVQFEWRRLAHMALVMGAVAVVGDLLLPTHGLTGLITRVLALGLIPVLLLVTGFAHPREIDGVRQMIAAVRRTLPTPAGSGS
jgi:peptidoglycan biosynthesis protein MviN/MurJ (putative lipid II flippase)